MTQLDDYTRRALCAADQPPPGVEERILAAILGPVGGPPEGGGAGTPPAPGSGGFGSLTLVHAAKIVGATLGLTAGGVALLAVTAAGVRSLPEQRSEPGHARVEAPLEQREVGPSADAVEPPNEAESTKEIIEAAPPPAPVARSVSSQEASKPAAAEPGSTIEAELALMQTARGSKDHERALAALERHRREFASGVFAAEREVLRVEHLCALGRIREAEAIADKFVVRHPDHPLRSRVEPACSN
ncbi:MAG: hypothetical protein R6X02_35450 [Enhygromyxa sp.]